MFKFRPQPLRHELVRPIQASDAIKKDPPKPQQPASGFRRFFRGPERASNHGQRADDINPRTCWSNLLATRRLMVQGALASIAEKPDDAAVQDYALRVERIAIAMHLLGIANGVIRDNPGPVPTDRWPPLLRLVDLLEKPYFAEPYGLSRFQYEAIQYEAIQKDLAAQGFGVLGSVDAAKKYLKHVKTRINQMRKSRQEPPSSIDIRA